MGVCCGLPGQEAAVFRLLEGRPSRSHALVLTRGLNLPSLGQKAAQQHTSSTGGFWSASPTAPPIQGTEDPTRRRLCWTWSLRARRIGSGKRRFEAASGEVFVYFKHKPAKNSKFQGSNHLLKVRCMLKSFPGSGPLLAISIYTGKKNHAK